MMGGLYILLSTGNLIRRMIGLAIFQTSTGLFYISLGKVAGGTAAIVLDAASPEGRALAVRAGAEQVRATASTASSIPIRCRTS